MIERYNDHAANERTFLAWIRTALAIMAFGFLVEKFDLFLEMVTASLSRQALPVGDRIVGDIAGLALIVLGGFMMVLAAIRYRAVRQAITAADIRPSGAGRIDLLLVGLLVLLGATLFVYLIYTIAKTF